MKISIIVPVYNAEKYIYNLYNSVINQTYTNWELILVNDGSTDNTLSILKELEQKDKRIKLINKENSGPGFSRKIGYQESSGELIFFIDSDDWITNDTVLDKINDTFNNNEIDVLFFDRLDIVEQQKNTIPGFVKMKEGIFEIDEINDIIRPGLGAKIFKSSILNDDMFIESYVFEDLYTTYIYLDNCKIAEYKKECFYTIFHEKNSNSLSSKTSEEKEIKAIEIIIDIYNKLKSNSLKISLLSRASNIYFSNKLRIIKNNQEYNSPKLKSKLNDLKQLLVENNIKLNNNNIIKKIVYKKILKNKEKVYERKNKKYD